MPLPEKGIPREDLLARMRERKRADADWRGGRTWSLIYPAGDDVDEVLREAATLYLFENALNPARFPSLKRMEGDVVSMATGLLHGGETAGGFMTSGGTESILMAVKTARDRARAERGIARGNVVVPVSAHPAFAKAAHYLDLELRQVPLDADLRADVTAAADLVTEATVLVAGSAPNYPHGVVDPIPELAALAAERGAFFHTDACVGGFVLPFLERLGHPVPPWDFRVPGVTTISADVHKYGYALKGASVIAHRDRRTRRYQTFSFDRWPGGAYGTPALAGARGAAPIAAAWAVMHYLGESGYLRLTRLLMDTTARLRAGIASTPGLRIWGDPAMSLLAFGSATLDIAAVGDAMDDRGWHLDRQTAPPALHMMVTPNHAKVADQFLADLEAAAATQAPARGKEARYSE